MTSSSDGATTAPELKRNFPDMCERAKGESRVFSRPLVRDEQRAFYSCERTIHHHYLSFFGPLHYYCTTTRRKISLLLGTGCGEGTRRRKGKPSGVKNHGQRLQFRPKHSGPAFIVTLGRLLNHPSSDRSCWRCIRRSVS